jgi:hypothetical protein
MGKTVATLQLSTTVISITYMTVISITHMASMWTNIVWRSIKKIRLNALRNTYVTGMTRIMYMVRIVATRRFRMEITSITLWTVTFITHMVITVMITVRYPLFDKVT